GASAERPGAAFSAWWQPAAEAPRAAVRAARARSVRRIGAVGNADGRGVVQFSAGEPEGGALFLWAQDGPRSSRARLDPRDPGRRVGRARRCARRALPLPRV